MSASPDSLPFVDYFTRVQATAGWAAILESFARFVAPPAGARILDVGCGPGALARLFARQGYPTVGVDSDPAMVERARQLAAGLTGAEFQTADILSLPFPAGSFDVALATNLIFLLEDPLAGVRALAAVCRVGGVVAMLNPSEQMSAAAAEALAEARGLSSTERASLVNWAHVAESNRRFEAEAAVGLFAASGLRAISTVTKIGPGLARCVRGVRL